MNIKFLVLLINICLSLFSINFYQKVNSVEESETHNSLFADVTENYDSNFGDRQLLENIAQKIADNYLKKKPVNRINEPLNDRKARYIQNQFVKLLIPTLGQKIGYKAALTNKNAQLNFGVNQPISGVFLKQMLLENNAVIPHNFGTRTRLEGDLIVRVKSDQINQAKTPEETLKYLDAVIPFIELPDLIYNENITPNAFELIAINTGARLGVKGDIILINNSQEWEKKLSNIDIIITDENNQELAKGNSKNLLGNPLNVVLWLKNNLNQQNILLKKGDLLSLGTITPMIPIKSNTRIKAEYFGLIEDKTAINITFK